GARVVGPARHRDEPLRGQEVDQDLVRREVQRGHARGGGLGARRTGEKGEEERQGDAPGHGSPRGRRSANTKPPRSTAPPARSGSGREKIGPSQAKVWNSPFSPQGSTSPGRRSRNSRSNSCPAREGGMRRGSRVTTRARSPAAIISEARAAVG